MQNDTNIEKMQTKKQSLGKTYKDYPNTLISFYTRYATMEVCFGDPNEEETNIAQSILQSLKKV